MINLLFRLGLWRKPMLPIHRCGWHMIALHMAEATPHRRLS